MHAAELPREMMCVRLLFAAAVLAFVGTAGTLCVAVAAPTPHTLRFASAEDIATLNPDLTTQVVVTYLSQMTGAYAFRSDHENRLVPELATVVPSQANGGISKDGMTVTLHFRPGLKWSDGAPFDAGDVAFTIGAINNPANSVPTRQGFDQIKSIAEPDRSTVVVHLKAPYGAIVSKLFSSAGTIAILPKHVLGALHDMNTAPFNGLPIGMGPFRYAAWNRGDSVVLERNPYYWRGQPALEHFVFKIIPDRNTVVTQLQTGELELFYPFGGAFLSRVAAIPHIHVIRQPGYGINQLMLNTKNPALADVAVRKALRYAIDRQLIRDKVGHGVGILQNVVVSTVDPSTPKDIRFTPFSLERANAILDAAGWKRGPDGVRAKNGTRLSLQVASSVGTPDADTIIELVRSWWTQIGVELSVRRYESSMLFGPYDAGGILENGKFDVMFLGQIIAAPFDLTQAFGCADMPPAGQNYSHYCDRALDAVMSRYDRTADPALRDTLLSQALHIIDDASIVIVTYGREDLFGVNDAVKNFTPNAATPFDDMMHVDVVP